MNTLSQSVAPVPAPPPEPPPAGGPAAVPLPESANFPAIVHHEQSSTQHSVSGSSTEQQHQQHNNTISNDQQHQQQNNTKSTTINQAEAQHIPNQISEGPIPDSGNKEEVPVRRSFAEVLCDTPTQHQQNNTKQNQQLQHNQSHKASRLFQFANKTIADREGKPVVTILKSEWKDLATKEEQIALIGRFTKARPNLDIIRSRFQILLPIAGSAHVGAMDSMHILIRFDRKDDCNRVLAKGQAVVEGKPVRFFRWSPDWNKRKESPFASAWVNLPRLPYHLFDTLSLMHICRPIGRLLSLDSATARRTRPSVARVKLEIDFSKPLVDKLWIDIVGEGEERDGFWQKIEFEKTPLFCSNCSKLGHDLERCRNRVISTVSEAVAAAPVTLVAEAPRMAESPATAEAAMETPVEAVTEGDASRSQAGSGLGNGPSLVAGLGQANGPVKHQFHPNKSSSKKFKPTQSKGFSAQHKAQLNVSAQSTPSLPTRPANESNKSSPSVSSTRVITPNMTISDLSLRRKILLKRYPQDIARKTLNFITSEEMLSPDGIKNELCEFFWALYGSCIPPQSDPYYDTDEGAVFKKRGKMLLSRYSSPVAKKILRFIATDGAVIPEGCIFELCEFLMELCECE